MGLTSRRLTFEPVPLCDIAPEITRLAALLSRSFALRRAFSARVRRLAERGRGAPNDAVRAAFDAARPVARKICFVYPWGALPCRGRLALPALLARLPPLRRAISIAFPSAPALVGQPCALTLCPSCARSIPPLPIRSRRCPRAAPTLWDCGAFLPTFRAFPPFRGLRYATPPPTRNNPTAQRAERANR